MSTSVRITPSVEALLAAHRIKFHRKDAGFRWEPGARIAVPDRAEIEPYAGFFSGRVLPTRMGAFSYSNALLSPRLEIGRYCSIAGGLAVLGASHPLERVSTAPFTYNAIDIHANFAAAAADWGITPTPQPRRAGHPNQIVMGHDVWAGEAVVLGRGIRIGTGAVLATRALVTKDVPPFHVVGGVPARTLKLRFPERVIERLLASEWWRYAFPDLDGLDTTDPLAFCDGVDERIAAGRLRPYEPAPLTAEALIAAAAADGQDVRPGG